MQQLDIYRLVSYQKLALQFHPSVKAGFPSPAADYMEKTIDLNDELIENKDATFYVRVDGESMKDANILDGDVLIVDRSLTAKNKDIVVASLNGEFTVKRFVKEKGHGFLMPENAQYKPIKITPDDDFTVWGVVTYVIHKLR